MCTLETDSPFLPVSPVVFGSLGRHYIAWLAFYAQAGSLLGAAGVALWYLGPAHVRPRLAIPVAALTLSAVVMIYFRLLGRLAFYCTTEPEEEEAET